MKAFTDYLFILDWNLIILDVKFPINENILDLSPIEIRDTKITNCNLGPEFNTKITKALDLIEKTGQTQEFLFELNLKEYYQLKCRITSQSQEKEKETRGQREKGTERKGDKEPMGVGVKRVGFPDRVMFTFHPQRWTDKPVPWFKELVVQNLKNVVKGVMVGRKG